ncbi:MAG TPA: CoA transferase, partial [Candidatus Binatus sp.]|nr:CoA transferase [Candidatus Binatus sp.]
ATMVGSILAFLNAPATETLAHGRVPGPYTRPRQSQTYAFACADGAMLAIHLSSPQKFWEGLCKSVGRPEMIEDPRFHTRPNRRANYDDLNKVFADFFKEKPRAEWIEQLEANDVPHTPVYNLKEVFDDPQVQHMGMQIAIERKDKPTIRTVKFPLTHSDTPSPFPAPPPELGENNGEFLKSLGYNEAKIVEFKEKGII